MLCEPPLLQGVAARDRLAPRPSSLKPSPVTLPRSDSGEGVPSPPPEASAAVSAAESAAVPAHRGLMI